MSFNAPEYSPRINQPAVRKKHPGNWRRVLLATVLFLILWLGYFGYSAFNTWRKIPESYAAWTTGNLIVDYLNTHSNQWPRSWEDLDRATNCQRYVPIEKLREQVKIDWDADFGQLLHLASNHSATALRVVTRPDGSRLHAIWGESTEPNRKIMGYLLWTLSQSNAPPNSVPD